MQLYAIRHLPTSWNKEGKLQGSNDIDILPISDTDRDIVELNRTNIQDIKFDLVLVSSLKRTHQTAQAYGYTDYTFEPLIDELNFGKYEGVEKVKMLDDLQSSWYDNAKSITLGESLIDFESRLKAFIKKYEGHTILLFAHGAVLRGLKAIFSVGDINEMNKEDVKNNSLIRLGN